MKPHPSPPQLSSRISTLSMCTTVRHGLHYWNTTLAKVLYCYLMQYSKLFMDRPKMNFWQMHWCNVQFKSFYGMTIDVKRICTAYNFSMKHYIYQLRVIVSMNSVWDFSLTENYYILYVCIRVSFWALFLILFYMKPYDNFSNIQIGYSSFIEIITFYLHVWNTFCSVDYHI